MTENILQQPEEKLSVLGITKASAYYCDKFVLRAAIQGVPWVGGSIDTLLAGLGAKYQYQRLEQFISELHKRFSKLEQSIDPQAIEPGEPLFDFTMQVFDHVIKSRSQEKHQRFANLFVNQIAKNRPWDEAETACRLLGDLTDVHIEILAESLNAPLTDFKNQRAVTLAEKYRDRRPRYRDPIHLGRTFPHLSDSVLRMICSELLSRGLMRDIGTGHFDTEPMEFLIATDLAKWLRDWICDPHQGNETL